MDLAEEEADAAELAASIETPDDSELSEWAAGYWTAWHILTNDRPLGAMGGAGRIPWSSIRDYARECHFDDPAGLARMLWAMDDVYLAWLTEQQKKPKPDAS